MNLFRKKDIKSEETAKVNQEVTPSAEEKEISPEVATVIALAIHLYDMKMKEDENAIITIQRIMKPYSPWSSKIYGLREQPLRIPGLRTRIK